MFVDEKKLILRAGKGGDGAVLFRREKYVPRGGPDGGDGGKGGDVVFVGRSNLHALSHLGHVDRIEAEEGGIGGHSRSFGKSGADARCEVPLGTEIFRVTDVGDEFIGEVLNEGDEFRVARGGNGGWGNWHFRSSTQQVPKHANPGQAGESFTARLRLKLIADIGLVGFPNAGKSTLLSVLSAAKPKIADYPFTTLEPQLGVAKIGKGADERTLVIADLPGLIEGASTGKGLGATFLKHIERTKCIAHCIAAEGTLDEIRERYQGIRKELEHWSDVLASKPEVVVLTKIDLISPNEREHIIADISKALPSIVIPVSAATHEGVSNLLTHLV